jgi:bifunctional UDP-N-acetylglucosamine pyrophosphorylase / glucosamine-1-phosphate N-acetyltransferase
MTAAQRRAPGRPSPARSTRTLAAVVLAAGRGKRLKSARPKVLHEICGRAMLWHVLRALRGARPDRIVIVVSDAGGPVEEAVRAWGITPEPLFVEQKERLGTGHAVATAERAVNGFDDVLVMAGDDPLFQPDEVRALVRAHRRTKAAGSILTTVLDDPSGYGRIVKDDRGALLEIGEQPDATPEVRAIREVATLVYAFRREDLFRALPLVGRENRQKEYYLHHVFPILREKGERLTLVPFDAGGTLPQVNSRAGIAKAGRIMRARILDGHMAAGVSIVDPDTTYVDVEVRIGADTTLLPMTFLEGDTRVGEGCTIGPSTRVVDSRIGDDAEVTFSVVRGAKLGRAALVGPYASLRPGTVIEERGKAGTFVEMKNTKVGPGSKVPHLSYMGDAVIGRHVNVGAGSITCNYDGYEKHRTVIGDESFIGSDTMLVAPVRLGKRVWTGAGSVVGRDVAAGSLAVERAEQRTVRGYDDRRRAAHGGKPPGGKRDDGSSAGRKPSRGSGGGARRAT